MTSLFRAVVCMLCVTLGLATLVWISDELAEPTPANLNSSTAGPTSPGVGGSAAPAEELGLCDLLRPLLKRLARLLDVPVLPMVARACWEALSVAAQIVWLIFRHLVCWELAVATFVAAAGSVVWWKWMWHSPGFDRLVAVMGTEEQQRVYEDFLYMSTLPAWVVPDQATVPEGVVAELVRPPPLHAPAVIGCAALPPPPPPPPGFMAYAPPPARPVQPLVPQVVAAAPVEVPKTIVEVWDPTLSQLEHCPKRTQIRVEQGRVSRLVIELVHWLRMEFPQMIYNPEEGNRDVVGRRLQQFLRDKPSFRYQSEARNVVESATNAFFYFTERDWETVKMLKSWSYTQFQAARPNTRK